MLRRTRHCLRRARRWHGSCSQSWTSPSYTRRWPLLSKQVARFTTTFWSEVDLAVAVLADQAEIVAKATKEVLYV